MKHRTSSGAKTAAVLLFVFACAALFAGGIPTLSPASAEETQYVLRFVTGADCEEIPEQTCREGERVVLPGKDGGYCSYHTSRDGKNYVLLGWTRIGGFTDYFNDGKDPVGAYGGERDGLVLAGGNYTVSGAHADGRNVIAFYAVWAADVNRDDLPDYSQTYYVSFWYDDRGELSPETFRPPVYTRLKWGDEVGGEERPFPAAGEYTLSAGGKNYVLLGWRKEGDVLAEREEDVPELLRTYTVEPSDDTSGSGEIALYAVWGIDGNGNGVPDWEDRVTVIYADDTMPVSSPLPAAESGLKRGDAAEGSEEELPRKQINGTGYRFLGWTTEHCAHRYDNGEGLPVLYCKGAPYCVAGGEGEVTLYAVWGKDENGDGLCDWEDAVYRLVFRETEEARDVSGLSGLRVGERFALPAVEGYAAGAQRTWGGKRYVFLGWTDVRRSGYLFSEEPDVALFSEEYLLPLGQIAQGFVLYAVWAEDLNGDGKPDYAQAFALSFSGGGAEGVVLPKPALAAAGTEIDAKCGPFAEADGKNYVFLGWTLCPPAAGERYLFSSGRGPELQKFPYTVHAADDADGDGAICFYAVWGVDENRSGAPDYGEVFSVSFVNGAEGTLLLADGTWRPSVQDLTLGQELPLAFPYARLQREEGLFVLIGWSLHAGENLFLAASALSQTYTVRAADDGDGDCVIKLYAAWGADKNRDGRYDGEEARYEAVFVSSLGGTFAPREDLLDGEELLLGGEGVRAERDGVRYLLVGWTAEYGEHVSLGDPFAPLKTFYRAGERYTVSAADSRDGRIVFYAVWAADNEEGAGDGTPDYLQTYTVRFVTGGEQIADVRLRVGESVQLRGGLFSAASDGRNYTLLGWSLRGGGTYRSAPPADAAEFSAGVYPLSSAHAGKDGVVLLYAVWGIDGNANGDPDYAETFTLRFYSALSGTELFSEELSFSENASPLSLPDGGNICADGKNYAFLGWTRSSVRNFCESRADFAAAGELSRAYLFDPAHAGKDGTVRFYAVWAIDENGNDIEDYSETFYVEFVCGGGELSLNGLPAEAPNGAEGLCGEEIPLPAGYVLSCGGKRYALAGWTSAAGESVLCVDFTEYLQKTGGLGVLPPDGRYGIAARDADEAGKIFLRAVWLDELAAREAAYTVLFENVLGLSRAEISGPAWQKPRYGLTPDGGYLSFRYGGERYLLHEFSDNGVTKRYFLIGWTAGGGGTFRAEERERLALLTDGDTFFPAEEAEWHIPLSLADETNVVTLRAVWAEDNNGNGVFDGEERVLSVAFADDYAVAAPRAGFEVSADGMGNRLLAGMRAPVPNPLSDELFFGGRRYVFLGWYSGEHSLLVENKETYAKIAFAAESVLAEEAGVYRAVWGTDGDDGGTGDGTPDFLQRYLVRFENRLAGEVVPYAPFAEHSAEFGQLLALPKGYRLEREGKRYTLVGWTAEAGDPVAEDASGAQRCYTEEYPVTPAHAHGGTIVLYAVWAADENGNSRPDYGETRLTLTYETGAEICPEAVTVLGGTAVTLADGLSCLRGGIAYLLIGWAADPAEGGFFEDRPSGEYIAAGSSYTVNASVTLHAVWAADENSDGVPDFLDTYTVIFDSSLPSASLPQTVGTAFGQSVRTPFGLFTDYLGTRYMLVGWTTQDGEARDHITPDGAADRFPFYLSAGEAFCAGPRYASDGTVRFYAVWAADENGNSRPDYGETRRRVVFESLVEGELTGSFPAYGSLLTGTAVPLPEGKLLSGGETYLLLGWTRTRGEHLLRAEPREELLRGEYVLQESDGEEVVLYAVWGIDNNAGTGNGIPDWREHFRIEFITNTPAYTKESRAAGFGEEIVFGEKITAEFGGINYALVGWTRRAGSCFTAGYPASGDVAAHADFTLGGAENVYTVDAAHAEGTVIALYAVWAADENANFVPDGSDRRIVFYDLLGKAETLPEELPYGGECVLPAVQTDDTGLVFLGWSARRADAEKIALVPPAGLLAEFSAETQGLCKLYAVWGAAVSVALSYPYGETGKFTAPSQNVGGGTLTLRGEDIRMETEVHDGNLAAAVARLLSVRLAAGEWSLESGDRVLARFKVLPRAVTVESLPVRDKLFDGTVCAEADLGGAKLLGVFPGDDVVLGGASASFDAKDAGLRNVRAEGLYLAGADAGNYLLPECVFYTHATIFRRILCPEDGDWSRYIRVDDKEYDGTGHAQIAVDGGWLDGFELEIAGYTAEFENAAAGTGKTVRVSLILSGADLSNVSVGEIVLTADIVRAQNGWVREFGAGNGPAAKFSEGEPTVEYFLDRACTQKAELSELPAGVYYVKVSVRETENWTGLESVYEVEAPAPQSTVSPLAEGAVLGLIAVQVALIGACTAALVLFIRKKS